ncbi:VgrG-related protein [Cellulomonas sp. URHD0024]|uniref:VgrG-related protein n=1 Tax=Cellulomonas sp. URHD0024 TaxID=1302620 RepID=UPI00047F1ABB|nr:VgrG-related protein [Cellulomonas sp. URHD0024]
MSPATGPAARPVISVGGTELTARASAALRSTVVDTDAHGPDSCHLTFDDPGTSVLADTGIDLADTLTVVAGRVGEDTGDRLFDGVVYAIGYDYDDRGGFTTITAYDRSYGLYTGLHTVSYQNMTDGDVARKVAKDAGLKEGNIASSSVLHEYVAQINETYFAFLERRAAEVGCVVTVVGEKLSFAPPSNASAAPDPGDHDSTGRLQLVPGENLQRLSVRVTAAQQVSQVQVRGWDVATKQALVGTTSAATTAAVMTDTPASVAQLFGSPTSVTVDVPLGQQAECDAAAKSLADKVGAASAHAEGVALGDPRIVAGAAVSIGATGGRFDGRVTVTRAKHVWDARSYRTSFTASGAHDRSVLGLVRSGSRPGNDRVAGLVVGIVTNVADPENACRVKVRFPWLDDQFESDWVRVLQLGAGNDRGWQLLPEVDDEVLVGFEQGDQRRPYVLGGLFNGKDKPPRDDAVDSGGAVVTRVWRSRTGHEVVLSDKQGEESVELRTGEDKVSLVMKTSDGSLVVKAEGDVTVEAKGDAKVTSTGDLTLHSDGAATISAGSGLTLEARSGNVTVKGTQIKLN